MIGLFNDNFPPILDGVALTVRNYADCMSRRGEQLCVVTANAPHEPYDLPYPVYRYASLPLLMRKPYRYGFPALDARLMRTLREQDFSIIHAHCPFMTGRLAVNIARQRRIPLVATFHSKYRQDFERSVPVKFVVDQMVKEVVNFYNSVDMVWIPQASVEPVLREYGYTGAVDVMDNGNDFVCPNQHVTAYRQHMREHLGLRQDETMLLFVGQHIWEKNIGFILDSIARIKSLPYHLFMIGIGYASEQIRKRIHELDLDNKVTMLGAISDRNVLKEYYAAADLFLFPSLYDNAPLVVREAAAMHTPTIMLSDSTSAEIIQSGYNGFLTINDIHVYAQTIRYLMENPKLVSQVGDNAALTIARSWDDVVGEVLNRYRDIQIAYRSRYFS